MNKSGQGWTLPSIFAVVGLFLLIGSFVELGFWWGILGFILIIISIWLYIIQF